MQIRCKKCDRLFNGTVNFVNLRWIGRCPDCGSYIEVFLPQGRIIMAFAEEPKLTKAERKSGLFTGRNIVRYTATDSPEKFMAIWKQTIQNPDTNMYWVIDNGEVICSGICKASDEEILKEHFGVK